MSEQRDGLGALPAKWREYAASTFLYGSCAESRAIEGAWRMRAKEDADELAAALAAHEGVEPSTEERAMASAADESYQCAHGHTFQARAHSMHDMPPHHCPKCGNKAVYKILGALAIHSTTPQGLPGAAHEEGGGARLDQKEPWAYAMETADGDWIDGENCIFGDRQSAQDEVDTRNDDLEPEEHVRLVPLYRAAALASQEPPAGEFYNECGCAIAEGHSKDCHTNDAPAGAASEAVGRRWAILFDDPDCKTEIYTSEATALKALAHRNQHWACYLFVEVDHALERATGAAGEGGDGKAT